MLEKYKDWKNEYPKDYSLLLRFISSRLMGLCILIIFVIIVILAIKNG